MWKRVFLAAVRMVILLIAALVACLLLTFCAGARNHVATAPHDESGLPPFLQGYEEWPFRNTREKSGWIDGEEVVVRTTMHRDVDKPIVGANGIVTLVQVKGVKTKIPPFLQWLQIVDINDVTKTTTFRIRIYVLQDRQYRFVKEHVVRSQKNQMDIRDF